MSNFSIPTLFGLCAWTALAALLAMALGADANLYSFVAGASFGSAGYILWKWVLYGKLLCWQQTAMLKRARNLNAALAEAVATDPALADYIAMMKGIESDDNIDAVLAELEANENMLDEKEESLNDFRKTVSENAEALRQGLSFNGIL